MTELLRIDVGSGERPYEDGGPEWTHFDCREVEHVDVVGDADSLDDYFDPASAAAIRAAHLLEHFSHRDIVDVLRRWRRVLVPGGTIYVEVPNLGWQVAALAGIASSEGKTAEEIVVLMYGEQDHEGNFHRNGFTQASLGATLSRAGFTEVSVQDIGMVLIAGARNPTG